MSRQHQRLRLLLGVLLLNLLVGAAAGVLATPQPQAEAAPLFGPVNVTGALDAQTDLGVLRTRYVSVNFSALALPAAADTSAQSVADDRVLLNLFPDVSLVAVGERLEAQPALPGGVSWIGGVEGEPLADVVLSTFNGQMEGAVLLPGRLFQITPAGFGAYAINEIDPDAFSIPHNPPVATPPPAAKDALPFVPPPGEPLIDVMVVYTPAARTSAGGTTSMVNLINSAAAAVNTGYTQSGVNQRIRLVHVAEINYTEVGGNGTDLDRLTDVNDGYADEVHTLRNTYGADLVTMITNSGNYCGIGWMMGSPSPSFAGNGFNIVVRSCLSGGLTFGHELGHNMGLEHNIEDSFLGTGQSFSPSYTYAFGYRDPGYFRTIMSYACSGTPCNRINYWSDPAQTYNGRPRGTNVGTTAGYTGTNETLALNNTAAIVAGFRGCQVSCGSGSITPTPVPTVSNDQFANARVVSTLPYTFTQDVLGATTSASDPTMCALRSVTVWYRYTAPYAQTLTIDTVGSAYDTVLGVYTGSEGALAQIACEDDSTGLNTLSRVTVNATAGTTYHILVAHYGNASLSSYTGLTLNITGSTPQEANLVLNGDMSQPLGSYFGFWGVSNQQIGGAMQITRQAGTPDGGFYQFASFSLPAGAPMEFTFNLSNPSNAPKTLNMIVRNSDWSDTRNCWFTLPAYAPQQTYTMRFKTTSAWSPIVIQGWLTGDAFGALALDNLDLRYRPSQTSYPTTASCTVAPPGDVNLVFDGGFDAGFAAWAAWNSAAQVVGGQMEIARWPNTPDGGIYQWNPYSAPAGGVFDYTFQLGNSSGVPKTVNMLVRHPEWAENRACFITIPANRPAQNFTMRFRADVAWPNIVIQSWLQNPDGALGLRLDNISLIYRPTQSMVGNLLCPSDPLDAPAAEASLPPANGGVIADGGISAPPAPAEADKPE